MTDCCGFRGVNEAGFCDLPSGGTLSTMNYRREIDGLRALAVVPVVLFHAGFPAFSGGFVGVDIFFVISGYLITSILVEENEKGRYSIIGFYERRARRILPALFFVIASCIPFACVWMPPDVLVSFGRSIVAVTLFGSNFLFWKETGYFQAAAEEKPLLHTWSLAVEEQYYLLFPLLITVLWPLGRQKTAWVLSIGAIGSLFLTEIGWRHWPTANFFLAPFRAWELLAGSLIALYFQTRPAVSRRWHDYAAFTGIALVVGAIVLFNPNTPFPSLWATLPVLGTAMIILFALPGTTAARLFSLPPLVGIGLISYSVYLWHQPLYAFARIVSLGQPSTTVYLSLATLSVVLGWVSWRFVESPFRQRDRFPRRAIFRMSAALIASFLLVGVYFEVNGGLSSRYNAEDQDLLVDLAERSRYVASGHKALQHKKSFDNNGLPRTLLIGDSFSEDFINILNAAGLAQQMDLQMHYTSTVCQLYYGDAAGDNSPAVNSRLCQIQRRIPPDAIAEAEIIILAFRWEPWAVTALGGTLDTLLAGRHPRVVLVGTKSFGRIRPAALLRIPASERKGLRINTPGWLLDLNAAMAMSSRRYEFIDMHSTICGATNAATCPVFDAEGLLLSHDGAHLTEAGVRLVVQNLGTALTQTLVTPVAQSAVQAPPETTIRGNCPHCRTVESNRKTKRT